jgi:hypothetical protein
MPAKRRKSSGIPNPTATRTATAGLPLRTVLPFMTLSTRSSGSPALVAMISAVKPSRQARWKTARKSRVRHARRICASSHASAGRGTIAEWPGTTANPPPITDTGRNQSYATTSARQPQLVQSARARLARVCTSRATSGRLHVHLHYVKRSRSRLRSVIAYVFVYAARPAATVQTRGARRRHRQSVTLRDCLIVRLSRRVRALCADTREAD